MITQAPTPAPAPGIREITMLQCLAEGLLSPLENLRDAIDLTLEQVADWLADAKNRRRIHSLLMLLDVQTQLLLSQSRILAGRKLVDVMNDPKASPETVRRACADVLKTSSLVDSMRLRECAKSAGEREDRGVPRLDPPPKGKPCERAAESREAQSAPARLNVPGAVQAVSPSVRLATPGIPETLAGKVPAPQSRELKAGKSAAPPSRNGTAMSASATSLGSLRGF